MPFCVSCNADLLIDEARFCPLCGTPQPEREVGAAAAPDAEWTVNGGGWDEDGYRVASVYPEHSEASVAAAEDGAPRASARSHVVVRFDAIARASKRLASSYEARLWRLALGDLVTALGCAAIVAGVFLPWFAQKGEATVRETVMRLGVPHVVTRVVPSRVVINALGAGAWHWIIVVLAALVLLYIGLRILPGRTVLLPLPHWQLLAVACSILLGLTGMSVALSPDLGKWTLQGGAFLGLGGAIVAAGGVVLRRGEPEVITSPVGNWFMARRIAYLQEKRQRAAEMEAIAAAAAAEKAAREETEARARAAAELATRESSRRVPEQLAGSFGAPVVGQWDQSRHVVPATVRVRPPFSGSPTSQSLDEGFAPGPPPPPEAETTVVRIVGAGGGSSAPPFAAPRPGEEVHVTRMSGAVGGGIEAGTPDLQARGGPLAGAVASMRSGASRDTGGSGGAVPRSAAGAPVDAEAVPPAGGVAASDPAPAPADAHAPEREKPPALECAVCGTVNLPSARACRTCGVMISHKPRH